MVLSKVISEALWLSFERLDVTLVGCHGRKNIVKNNTLSYIGLSRVIYKNTYRKVYLAGINVLTLSNTRAII